MNNLSNIYQFQGFKNAVNSKDKILEKFPHKKIPKTFSISMEKSHGTKIYGFENMDTITVEQHISKRFPSVSTFYFDTVRLEDLVKRYYFDLDGILDYDLTNINHKIHIPEYIKGLEIIQNRTQELLKDISKSIQNNDAFYEEVSLMYRDAKRHPSKSRKIEQEAKDLAEENNLRVLFVVNQDWTGNNK